MHITTVLEMYTTCHPIVVQVMFTTNYVKSFNEHIRFIFSLSCCLERLDNPYFVNYFHTFIYYGSPMINYWISQMYNFNA